MFVGEGVWVKLKTENSQECCNPAPTHFVQVVVKKAVCNVYGQL